MKPDETLVLDLLNTTRLTGDPTDDDLADPGDALRWLAAHGQPATEAEWRTLLDLRPLLQEVVRGHEPPSAVARFVEGVGYHAALGEGGIDWSLHAPPGRSAAASAVLGWDALRESGRLRPCANPECRRFLVDHSKAGTARWCSMSSCGNRLKARRHYQRARQSEVD
ncbi:CGNR zinc finger domain-containing protein [Amycolatopsis rhabdoformis]|uniref:CGNR zinc finger domain-containing protein n=1 Tax=Amycolatopsis rhabdoformis TaxID=1448059 RepID=A0ABZ1IBK6_9PSEU|nr:CGNR zinc finger domain-containing protein [Amycolatopsis rhabdoformis]WSE31861.1 CGNR zinc finger domain-containing protein [Amycolatopsis rhabdoformis]